ncbi:MAG: steroid-24-oyl-CoA synthetase, partial [Variibacter sp.]|nr:steroid-24-oyl-CoA synthetase [Variibacter sp.]
LLAVPFFHATGCQAVLAPAVQNGGKIVMMHRWDTERALQLIECERCTHVGNVPTIAWQLAEHPAREKYDLSSLEVVAYGGAPAAAELVRRIKQVFPQARPGQGWGMTETAATFTTHVGDEYEAKPDSCGPALPVCDMKVVDDGGQSLPPGKVGELWVRGPNVVKGYWNKPEATAATFENGWLKTGDLAWLDEEGFGYVVDRKKDMLIRGGENIYCIEVEDVIYKHAAVMDAAVIGLPHRTLGEEPAAVVTLAPGKEASEAGLRAFVAERLAAFKVPVRIAFAETMLPRNPNGKIMKNELRRYFPECPSA